VKYCCELWNINISQGSVAACLMYGGIFINRCIGNVLPNVPVEKLWKSININELMKFGSSLFYGPQSTFLSNLLSTSQNRASIIIDKHVYVPAVVITDINFTWKP